MSSGTTEVLIVIDEEGTPRIVSSHDARVTVINLSEWINSTKTQAHLEDMLTPTLSRGNESKFKDELLSIHNFLRDDYTKAGD